MPISKGGRGKAAPYDTIQVRCPKPIHPQIKQFIHDWHDNEASAANIVISNFPSPAAVAELEAEIAQLKKQISEQEKEILELHAKNGDLGLALQLKQEEAGQQAMKKLNTDIKEAITLLDQSLTKPANKGGAIKADIKQALRLMER